MAEFNFVPSVVKYCDFATEGLALDEQYSLIN